VGSVTADSGVGHAPAPARLAHRKSTPPVLWHNIESLGQTARRLPLA